MKTVTKNLKELVIIECVFEGVLIGTISENSTISELQEVVSKRNSGGDFMLISATKKNIHWMDLLGNILISNEFPIKAYLVPYKRN